MEKNMIHDTCFFISDLAKSKSNNDCTRYKVLARTIFQNLVGVVCVCVCVCKKWGFFRGKMNPPGLKFRKKIYVANFWQNLLTRRFPERGIHYAQKAKVIGVCVAHLTDAIFGTIHVLKDKKYKYSGQVWALAVMSSVTAVLRFKGVNESLAMHLKSNRNPQEVKVLQVKYWLNKSNGKLMFIYYLLTAKNFFNSAELWMSKNVRQFSSCGHIVKR